MIYITFNNGLIFLYSPSQFSKVVESWDDAFKLIEPNHKLMISTFRSEL